MKIIEKGRRLETKHRIKRETKKQLKNQYYRIFLHENHSHLPSKNKLKRWRRNCIIATILCIMIPSIQIIYFRDSLYTPLEPLKYNEEAGLERILQGIIRDIPLILGLGFFAFSFFAICIEWVIYRRWPQDTTIFNQLLPQNKYDHQQLDQELMQPNQKPNQY